MFFSICVNVAVATHPFWRTWDVKAVGKPQVSHKYRLRAPTVSPASDNRTDSAIPDTLEMCNCNTSRVCSVLVLCSTEDMGVSENRGP